ncbi:AhpC-TSA-domain-containing protein [Aspergillus avenaceus]|uniref:thioredoxin-dependent peroxiredoxin n=1 Tax=Aspergillus avenaceus TaxID=36643 RepID=A0A5N6THL8_ASPAV|nr:AhpC-TSA-domain-containing protein [Aspergillus avenaceus]
MVELRKRKAPTQPATSSVAGKRSKKCQQSLIAENPAAQPKKTAPGLPSDNLTAAGDSLVLKGFGGEIETNDGVKTDLEKLVDESKSGVLLFTYPRASTPGCTKQACMFRDSHNYLSSTGFSVYGLSTDSLKANSTFRTKQKLPFPLLCDSASTLIAALGLKRVPKGTIRGVVAVDKQGKVLLLKSGGPDATVEAARQLVASAPNNDRNIQKTIS